MNEPQSQSPKFHPNVKDISGLRFGTWTVINRTTNGPGRNARWNCVCDCGFKGIVSGNGLRTGASGGCRGCQGPKIAKAKTIHGEAFTRTYSCWSNMKSRATSNKTLEARRYAKRDISIDPRWSTYEVFLEDMGHCPSDAHSLDRKNNNLGYCKDNCRWATQTEQQRNKSSNRIVEYKGERMCVSEFAEKFRMPYRVVAERIRAGWDLDDVIHKPVKVVKQRPNEPVARPLEQAFLDLR